MSLPDLSIRRPILITCVFLVTVVMGVLSLLGLGVDLFPNINFPVVSVSTVYPGAGPREIESLVTRPIEDTLSTLSGIKSVKSSSKEGYSSVIAEFTLDTDLKYAEQQIRDRTSVLRAKLPAEAKDPIVSSIDPGDQPILILTLAAQLPPARLFDLADREVRTLLEQAKDVGQVDVVGGRRREIQVLLDLDLLKTREMSATQVAAQLASAGKNIPAGNLRTGNTEALIRTLGEFDSLKDVRSTIVTFFGNETPVRVADVADVRDGVDEEKTRSYVNGSPALSLKIFRKSGANTIAVVDAVKERVQEINNEYRSRVPGFELTVVRDGARPIELNVQDVTESIVLGIILTVVVVFFFLGNLRSTVITGLALPNSLLGAFVLMAIAGFSINIMTLLALSLAVGLLIDDAIVVRENIYRHIEAGEPPYRAASLGTKEVTMAVVATTLTVIAVFGPVAFLHGIVGQFFKEFGLTICFAMLISLFDALTMAPMLSAYFVGTPHRARTNAVSRFFGMLLDVFNTFQDWLDALYHKALQYTLRHQLIVLLTSLVIFAGSFLALSAVPKTFIPPQDAGDFSVEMDMPAGTTLEAMDAVARRVDARIRENKEVARTVLSVGGSFGEANVASVFVQLVPQKERVMNTSQVKDAVRDELKEFSQTSARVMDVGFVGGQAQQPFNVNIVGSDLEAIETTANALFEFAKTIPDLQDVSLSTRSGKPEFRVELDKPRGETLGVSTTLLGQELRTLIEGAVPAVLREAGNEYNIHVRLKEEDRDLKRNFQKIYVPNVNQRLIRLADVAHAVETTGVSTIHRQDRGRYIQLSAALNPDGRGMAHAIDEIRSAFESGKIALPQNVRYQFVGQAESFQDLVRDMGLAAILSVLFIFLVLASLYESFLTPLTIMLVLPLAACGAFYALALTGSTLDIFSMIGCIMLLGVATKNSILLVDYINKLVESGIPLREAILSGGRARLRPIIMTSVALIAGMLPVAVGLNEAAKQRSSMGIAVIGGLVSSTLLTLVVVPAAYAYIENFRKWFHRSVRGVVTSIPPEELKQE